MAQKRCCGICGILIRNHAFNQGEKRSWAEECRAIYTFGFELNTPKISGVGVPDWQHNLVVPQNPSKRYDDRNNDGQPPEFPHEQISIVESDGQTSVVPARDSYWGFYVHDVCWSLFTWDFNVNLEHLLHLYMSTPIGPCGLIGWGGSYGGAAHKLIYYDGWHWAPTYRTWEELEDMFELNPLHIPILKKAIGYTARLQQDVFMSKLNPQTLGLEKDVFSYLPPEVLETVITLLPTPDVRSLRLASPVFATLGLSERFWASRFYKGREFEYLPDVFVTPPASWRAFYLSLHVWASDNEGIQNRKRVWTVVKELRSVLRQMAESDCRGLTNEVAVEETKSQNHMHSMTARRQHRSFKPTTSQERSLCFPESVQFSSVCVSFVKTIDGSFVSGLSFVAPDGQTAHLGYIHRENMVGVRLGHPQCVMGFELAFDVKGIRAIKVIAEDGTRWGPLGDPKKAPWKLLESDDGISTLHACFDATRLQILERRTVVQHDDQNWRLDYLWSPQIPPEPISFTNHNGLVPHGIIVEDVSVPIQVCIWGLEGDNRRLTSIWSSIYDMCHVASLSFSFESENGEESSEEIGDIGPMMMARNAPRRWEQSGSGLNIDIDGMQGENISGLEVQISEHLVVGLKVKTDRRKMRLTHRGGLLDKDPGTPWFSVKPEPGNRVVGIWATGGGFADALFNNIGLITVEE